METMLIFALALLLILLILVVGGLIGARVLTRRYRAPEPVPSAVFDSAAQQAQIQAVMEQAYAGNRQMLESERARDRQALEGERTVIDTRMADVARMVENVGTLMNQLEKDRESKFSALATQLAAQKEQVAGLTDQAQGLREALTSGKTRGQWGERMAEDQFRAIGFIEGTNYRKRTATEEGIPDFSIYMPQSLFLHMDVKFPLDNYLAYLDADDELEQRRCADQFIKDVRRAVKDLSARGYHRASNSLDYTLLYVPVESVYAFVHEQAPQLVNEALDLGIVFASPSTLFCNLSMVRQAVESFNLAEATHEVVDLLALFTQQYGLFQEEFQKFGRSIDTITKDYEQLTGTRVNQMRKLSDRVDGLRRDRAELRPVTDAEVAEETPPALEA